MPEDGDGFSGLLLVVQMIAVPLLASVLGLALVEFFDFATGTHGGNLLVALFCYSIVGLAEGFFVQKASGSAAGSGGFFIWIPLLCIIVAGVLRDGRGPGAAISELLTWNPYSLKGLASFLLTMPAWATCCYSLGVFWASKRSKTQTAEGAADSG
jgi:hypothetical protein